MKLEPRHTSWQLKGKHEYYGGDCGFVLARIRRCTRAFVHNNASHGRLDPTSCIIDDRPDVDSFGVGVAAPFNPDDLGGAFGRV